MKRLFFLSWLLAVLASAHAADAGAIVSISNVKNIVQGYTGSFDVVLNTTNTNLYTTLGLDVQLPEGFTYTGYAAGSLLTASHVSNISTSDQGSNSTRFGSYANPTADFTATQGVLLTIYFSVSNTAVSGTAYVKNASFSLGSESYYATDCSATLTVGNTVTLSDDESYTPTAVSGVDVTVNRTLKADVWNTICLPFAMSAAQITSAFGAGAEVASLSGVSYTKEYNALEEENVVTGINISFTPATEIIAHKPYIIKVSSAMTSFTVSSVDITTGTPVYNAGTSSNYKKFVGTYNPTTIPDGGLYISDNKFKYSGGNATLKAFRGYFDFRDKLYSYNTASAPAITFDFDGTTGVGAVSGKVEEARDEVYNLHGQRVAHGTKGVYIQNGKKIIIK